MPVEKKPTTRGVVDSIERLRLQRYMTKGPGAKRAKAPAPLPSVDQLRAQVSKVGKTKVAKRKKNRTRR